MNLRLIGLSTLAGLAITAGIGAASNTVSPPPARRAVVSQRLPVRATLDRERLRKAIWQKESSGQEYPEAGDDGASIGPYQVKYPRFTEYRLPGERYRSMTPSKWHAWMKRAITGYMRDVPRGTSVEDQVRHAGAQHNGSGPKARAYGRDILRRYKGNK